MTVDPKAFGAELRRRREIRGWTQLELAKRMGMTSNSVARLERGEKGPSLSAAYEAAKALRCRIEDLLRGSTKGGRR